MKIKINFEGRSPFESLQNGDEIEVEPGSTIADLLTRLQVKEAFHAFVIPFVNGDHKPLTYVFEDQDELKLFLPVSGG